MSMKRAANGRFLSQGQQFEELFGMEATKWDLQRIKALERLADKGVFRSLGNAAAAIRASARALIERSKTPSRPGEPVHTKRGKAKRPDAILYAVGEDDAVVGFAHHAMGEAMSGHEHGEKYMGTDYPARPTMGPAFEANLVRFADEFQGSIGE